MLCWAFFISYFYLKKLTLNPNRQHSSRFPRIINTKKSGGLWSNQAHRLSFSSLNKRYLAPSDICSRLHLHQTG